MTPRDPPTAPGEPSTVLVTLTGRDRPGVTARLFGALAAYDVQVLDVEQVVIRGRLVLCALVSAPPDEAGLRRAVGRVADALGMDSECSTSPGGADAGPNADPTVGPTVGPTGRMDTARPPDRLHVTMLARPLRPAAVAAVTGRLAHCGANIDRIVRLAGEPVTALELDVSGADPARLREELVAEAARQRVDVAVQPAGLLRRAKRLVVMDVDSTLVQQEVIELLAARAGAHEEVARVTAAAMQGELDFASALHARVALLAGLPAQVLDDVRREVRLAPGARTLVRTLKRLDHRFAVVSGGFTQIIDPLARELGIDYAAANTLEVRAGRLTGRLVGELVDRKGKAAALERFAAAAGVPLAHTVAIGDGANDLDMLSRAGLGVAFNAKAVVREAADASVSVPYLDAVLYLLGITREEVEAADAADAAGLPTAT
jgi:phosphoserine phosphatase